MRSNLYKTVMKEIKECECIAIGGHINPDGDAIASSLSLAMAISKMGKKPYVYLESIPKKYDFIKGSEFLHNDLELKPDLFIAVDCGDEKRLGESIKVFNNADKTIVIDHHEGNPEFGDINIIEDWASSTAEMIFKLLDMENLVDRDIGSAIYAGIIFDTGGLRFSSTSERTLKTINSLMDLSIPFTNIYNRVLHSHNYKEVIAFGAGIKKMIYTPPIAYSYLDINEMENLGIKKEDIGGIAEYLLNTDDIKVAVFGYEESKGIIKLSFRSEEFNVGEFARNYNGGGHALASGATVEGKLPEKMEEIINKLDSELKK